MTNKEITDCLGSLVKLDYDAMQCYEQAIDAVDDKDIRRNLQNFHDEHAQHVADLNDQISELGSAPVAKTRDLKGFFLEGFTSIRSMTGTDGALHAMETNEKTTNKKYKEAVEKDFPFDVRAVLEKNYGDEIRHLEYIQEQLHVRAS